MLWCSCGLELQQCIHLLLQLSDSWGLALILLLSEHVVINDHDRKSVCTK